MRAWPIAVRLESVGRSFREALPVLAQAGFQGIEFDAVGDLAPSQLSQTGRREVIALFRRYGLRPVAIGFPTRHGYDHLDRLEARIAGTEAALLLAYDLGVPIVINQLGQIPPDEDKARQKILSESLTRLSQEGDRVGAKLALQTGTDSPSTWADLLASIPNAGLAVNFAPASLVASGEDLELAVEKLAPWIVGVHARDVVRSSLAASGVREVPLGEGEINWRRLLRLLSMVEGCQHLTLISEPGAQAEKSLIQGKAYLASLIE
ncbi:sugar phosphate isomerase/epimerase [bacterium]|nr:sugar phosphate isomerase/epimerase [bacterium]